MQKLVITGEKKINGEISVHGAKNAALPLLAACVLTNGIVTMQNCPKLSDVYASCRILTCLGCKCQRFGDTVKIDTTGISKHEVPEDLMREIVEWVDTVLSNQEDNKIITSVREKVNTTMKQLPLFKW